MPDRPTLFPTETRPRPASSSPGAAEWTTAFCDGGARGNPGPAGFGALIQAPDGSVLGELSEYLGLRTNNFAEYAGLLASLDFALQHGLRRLRVTSDSELMVKQIQGKYQVKSPDLRPLYEAAKSKIAQLDAFEITHALRHKNKAADALANQAMDRGMNRTADLAPPAGPLPQAASRPAAAPQRPAPQRPAAQRPAAQRPAATPAMLRGFTKDGVIHLLGGHTLPDGAFVKIIPGVNSNSWSTEWDSNP